MTEPTGPKNTTPATPKPATPKPADTPKAERRTPAEVPFAPVADAGFVFVERMGAGRRGAERSDYMQQLDKLVINSRETGVPVFLECDSKKEAVADLEKRIRNSGTYTKNGIRFGDYGKSKTRGKVIVSFIAAEMIKRPRKPKTAEPTLADNAEYQAARAKALETPPTA